MLKRITAVILLIITVFTCSVCVCADTPHSSGAYDIMSVAKGIIEWKKSDVGSASDGFLINDSFCSLPGLPPGTGFL